VTRRRTILLGLLGLAVAGATAALVGTSDVLAMPTASAAVRTATIVTWVLCGLWTWNRRPDSLLGPVMVWGVLIYSLGALNAIDAPLPFTLGSALWVGGAYLIAYVSLAFPDGRITERRARWTGAVLVSLTGFLWLLLLLGADPMPTMARPFRCEEACPSNPLAVLDLSPAAGDALETAANGAFGVLSIALIVILIARMRSTSRVGRRVLIPPTVCLCLVAASFAALFVLTRAAEDTAFANTAGWSPAVISIAFPVALLVGQARGRLFAAGSLRDMVRGLSSPAGPRGLESMMADALGDPTLRLAFPLGDGFVDSAGAAIAVPGDPPAAVTQVRDADQVTAVVLHDPALNDPAGTVEAVGAAVQLALENARLGAAVRASERELRESRARMLTAGVSERRRLERDLHDTAQQQLVALRIKFALAEERTSGELRELLRELGADVESTIDRVRAVGRGLYPPLLADRGVGAALGSSVGAAGEQVALTVGSLPRTHPDIEAAVYLCCHSVIDALARKAAVRSRIVLDLAGDDLRIAVAAESADRPRPPLWLVTHMNDHLGSLGGRVTYFVEDRGWRIEGSLPWPRVSADGSRSPAGCPHGM
jgi:signal transduction histidine kinase